MVLVVKYLPANAGEVLDMGLIPGLGRSPRVLYPDVTFFIWLCLSFFKPISYSLGYFIMQFAFFYVDHFKSRYWIIILLLYYALLFWPWCKWDLSSLTRHWTCTRLRWKAKSSPPDCQGTPCNLVLPQFNQLGIRRDGVNITPRWENDSISPRLVEKQSL